MDRDRDRLHEILTAREDRAGMGDRRRMLTRDLRGNVLEIGCGAGRLFPYYLSGTRVTALEPDRARRARPRAAGVGMSGHLTHRLILRAHGQIFSYDDAWEVDFVDTLAAIEYAAFKHVTLGVGYDYFRIEYSQDKYDLYVNYTFQGGMLYVRVVY